VLIVIALGFGTTRLSGQILAGSFVAAGVAQLALVGRALLQSPRHPRGLIWRPSDDTRLFYARALPALIAGGIPQLALIAGTIIASTTESAVSWLYYSYRLYELPLGVIAIAIASVLAPRISAGVHDNMPGAARQAQSHALEFAIGLAAPATIGLIVLALPITELLFQRGSFTDDDTFAVAAALAVIAIGLTGHAIEKVLGAIAFAHEDTHTPMRAALVGLGAAAAVALALVYPLGHVGVAAGIAVAGWVSSGFLMRSLHRRSLLAFEPQMRARLGAIGMANLIMAAVLGLILTLKLFILGRPESALAQLVSLTVQIGGGLAAYAASLHWYRIIDLPQLIAAVRR
jgi:putative peptidoglycan lipid II flippase